MNQPQNWQATAAGALIGLTLLSGVSALLALSAQTGPLMSGHVLGFAEAHDRRAFKILERPASQPELELASREAAAALQIAPYNNAARLRLVYILGSPQEHLSGTAIKGLQDSYALVPLDHTVGAWRIDYALEHWRELSPDLRAAVHAEALAFGRVGSQDVDVRRVLGSVRSPEGKLAASLWLRELAR